MKITPIAKPRILKGRRINHTKGSRNNIMMANGQHKINRIHQRTKPIKVIVKFYLVGLQKAGQFL